MTHFTRKSDGKVFGADKYLKVCCDILRGNNVTQVSEIRPANTELGSAEYFSRWADCPDCGEAVSPFELEKHFCGR